MSEPVVRLAEPGDWDAINEVRRLAEEARSGRGARLLKQDGGTFAVVADDAGSIVGTAIAQAGREDWGAGPAIPGLAHVLSVAVHPDRWSEGIGTALVERILDEAWAREYDRAQLFTNADNTRAQSLYEHLGWARSGIEITNDLGDPILHYERDL